MYFLCVTIPEEGRENGLPSGIKVIEVPGMPAAYVRPRACTAGCTSEDLSVFRERRHKHTEEEKS